MFEINILITKTMWKHFPEGKLKDSHDDNEPHLGLKMEQHTGKRSFQLIQLLELMESEIYAVDKRPSSFFNYWSL